MAEPGYKTWCGGCECGICGHEWRAEVEIEDRLEEPVMSIECPECGSMAGMPGV